MYSNITIYRFSAGIASGGVWTRLSATTDGVKTAGAGGGVGLAGVVMTGACVSCAKLTLGLTGFGAARRGTGGEEGELVVDGADGIVGFAKAPAAAKFGFGATGGTVGCGAAGGVGVVIGFGAAGGVGAINGFGAVGGVGETNGFGAAGGIAGPGAGVGVGSAAKAFGFGGPAPGNEGGPGGFGGPDGVGAEEGAGVGVGAAVPSILALRAAMASAKLPPPPPPIAG